MDKRYSHWLEEEVYCITQEQEQILIDFGYEIEKPETVDHGDNFVRDQGHYPVSESKNVYVRFNRRDGKFELVILTQISDTREYESFIEELTTQKRLLDLLNELK